ncbi:FHA domain-containing protein [Streptomyces apocyni]|uniref:FHA domain-containing protein n=1 Tax=Streptomyces apocyni TaxID=2654677 RepID=UPI0018D1B147|nr:FHA domain-containing protein [Streptomyces apocyni]
MVNIIVVPMAGAQPSEQIRLEPGDVLRFGRALPAEKGARQLSIPHHGVSRKAGSITAAETFWTLSNFSRTATYVVENPEGAGEHMKVAPGRLGAPVPFEFSRVVLPAADEFLSFDVWAPRHEYLDHDAAAAEAAAAAAAAEQASGQKPAAASASAPAYPSTVLGFPLDHSKRYFMVLAALCEPRLRGVPHAPVPTADQVVQRLRPVWPDVSRTAVNWSIDYLAVKLRLKPGPDEEETGPRLHGKKEVLVSLALRFNLVREDDLDVLGRG